MTRPMSKQGKRAIGTIVTGTIALLALYTCADSQIERKLEREKCLNQIVKERYVEYKDVNSDGLRDIIVYSGGGDGQVFYQTKEEKYLSIQQIKGNLEKELSNRHQEIMQEVSEKYHRRNENEN